MYTLFGDVLSRSLLAQNPEPERGAREKREERVRPGRRLDLWEATHAQDQMLKFLVFPCCACAATVSVVRTTYCMDLSTTSALV